MKPLAVRELGETNGERALRTAARSVQVAIVVLLTFVAAMPFGLPAQARHVLPLLPLAAISHLTLRRPGTVPEWLAFLCGLALDILTQGPLGFWAFVYLAAYALALVAWPLGARGAVWRLMLVALALALSALTGWVVASLYAGSAAPARPWFDAALWALAPALAVVGVLRLAGGLGRRRANVSLEREGWR